MRDAFICDGIRTPIGRYGGALASVRADDLAAIPLRELLSRNPGLDPSAIDDVIFGCANQAGEDNRNVAHYGDAVGGATRRASPAPPSTGCVVPAWMRSALPHAPSKPGMRI
ncbi:Beta-ketoadipyl-CoA thiolase [Raoultella ornithinolytica]|nr:Beta-ketoadipyl-CoA thiolase [Raoultella ornithinolytica]